MSAAGFDTPEFRAEIVDAAHEHYRTLQQAEEPDAAFTLHDTILPVLAQVRVTAKHCGYAIGWHGSMARDLDLIAVPWTEHAIPPEEMVAQVVKRIGAWVRVKDECPTRKPHGRLAWSLYLIGSGVYLDLSVMPLRNGIA